MYRENDYLSYQIGMYYYQGLHMVILKGSWPKQAIISIKLWRVVHAARGCLTKLEVAILSGTLWYGMENVTTPKSI